MSLDGLARATHLGRVLDNADPDGRGGIKVQIDTIRDGAALGDDYIPPAFPAGGAGEGFFFVPKVGSQVEVSVLAEADRSLDDLDPRYHAVLYSATDEIPEEFRSDPPNRGGIKFGDGVLLFDKDADLLGLLSASVRLGIEGADQPVVRGTTYNSEENTLLAALNTFLEAFKVYSDALFTATGVPSISPAAQVLINAVNTFLGKQATWLSERVKVD